MEFRTLTGSDLGSLLELYQQLDPKDGLSAEACEAAWKEIEKNPDIRYFGAVEDALYVARGGTRHGASPRSATARSCHACARAPTCD